MDIKEEYEDIIKIIGEEKWNYINKYIKINPEYTISDIVYNSENWHKYNIWFNENIKRNTLKIINIWVTDYADIAVNAIFYKDNKAIANITTTYNEGEIRYVLNDNNNVLSVDDIKRGLKILLFDDFDNLSKLPKISKCSLLMQEIYDSVYTNDSSMCHIDNEDWEEFYSEKYSHNSFIDFCIEVNKYNLQDVIGINDCGYKIVGYGDLITRFNDDRNLIKEKVLER